MKLSNEEWFRLSKEPVTVTPEAVADIIHQIRYRNPNSKHGKHLSCPCLHQAMIYLGLEDYEFDQSTPGDESDAE